VYLRNCGRQCVLPGEPEAETKENSRTSVRLLLKYLQQLKRNPPLVIHLVIVQVTSSVTLPYNSSK